MATFEVEIDIKYPRGRSGPWIVDAKIGDKRYQIPAYHVRDDSQHEEIAADIAANKRGVGFGVGLYGAFMLLDDPRRRRRIQQADPASFFTLLKSTRAPYDRLTTFIPPKDVYNLIDFDKVHRKFRPLLQSRQWRERAWREGVSFHLIVPIPDHAHFIHPLLVTTPQDLIKAGKPPEQLIGVSTISAFWWYDPDMEQIAERVATLNPFGIVGMTSCNEHGQPPAYVFEGVIEFIQRTGITPDFIIRDEVGEAVAVRSSHPQFRVPLVGEPAEWVVARHGSISIDGWLKAINSSFPARGHATASWAARAESRDVILDSKVFQVRNRVDADFHRRHSKIGLGRIISYFV